MENKFQHYVPQFYLRNFSNNGKSVGSFVFSNHKYIENAPIRSICGRDYLYGDDLNIEKWFQRLERIWSRIINKIISSGNLLSINDEEKVYLLMLFYLSDARTAYVADTVKEEVNTLNNIRARLYREHRGIEISDDEINDLEILINKPNLVHLQNMPQVVEMIADLSIVLLHNTSSRQFITSDCPIAKYNKLFLEKNYYRSYGYGHVGTQVFLPISPIYCLVLYDASVYEFKSVKDYVVTVNAPNEIIELNKLFVKNSKCAIYFNNTERDWIIKRMVEKKRDTSKIFHNGVFGDDKQGYLVVHSSGGVHDAIKMPLFIVKPECMNFTFPKHAGGPLRPWVEQLSKKYDEEEKNENNISSYSSMETKFFKRAYFS